MRVGDQPPTCRIVFLVSSKPKLWTFLWSQVEWDRSVNLMVSLFVSLKIQGPVSYKYTPAGRSNTGEGLRAEPGDLDV